MCVACVEYSKDKLTVNEFQSALREMTVDSPDHARAVEKILKDYAGNPSEIKKRLGELLPFKA